MKLFYTLLLFVFSILFLKAQELEYSVITGGSYDIHPWEMIQADSTNTIIHGVSEDGDFLVKLDEEYNVLWDRIIQQSNQNIWDLQSKNIIKASDTSFYYLTGFQLETQIHGIAIHEIDFNGTILESDSYLFDQEVKVKFVHFNARGKLSFSMNYNNTVLYCQKDSSNNLTYIQLSNDQAPLEINGIKTLSDSLTILLGGTQLEQDGGFPIAFAINTKDSLEWSKQYEKKENSYLWKAFDVFQGDSINYLLMKESYGSVYHTVFDINTGETSNSTEIQITENDISGPIASRYVSSDQDNIYMKAGLNLIQIGSDENLITLTNDIGIHAFEMIDSTAFHYTGALGLLPVKNTSFFSEFGIKKGQNLSQIFNINFGGICEWLETTNNYETEILSTDIDIIVNYGILVKEDVDFLFEEYPLSKLEGCVRLPDNIQNTAIDYTLAISPNPSTGQFYVELENETLKQIQVYNEIGSLIQTVTYANGTTNVNLDLRGYSSGIYFVRMDMEYSSTMKKVIVHQ